VIIDNPFRRRRRSEEVNVKDSVSFHLRF